MLKCLLFCLCAGQGILATTRLTLARRHCEFRRGLGPAPECLSYWFNAIHIELGAPAHITLEVIGV
jgi:hypothetical protein